MVQASSMSPSQMFQERIVINMSRKFITAIIFHFFLFYSYCSSRNRNIYFFSSESKVMGRHQVMIHPMETSFLKVYTFPSKSKWKPRGPEGRINQPKKSYSGLTPNLDSHFIYCISKLQRELPLIFPPQYSQGYLLLVLKSLPSCHYCVCSSFAQEYSSEPKL